MTTSNKIDVSRAFALSRYEDLLAHADGWSDGTNTLNFINGFFAPYAMAVDSVSLEPVFPKLYQALGFLGIDAASFALDFEMPYHAEKASRNMSLTASMLLATLIDPSVTDIDIFKPYDGINIDYGDFFLKAWQLLEIRYGDNLLAIAKAYLNTQYKPLENYSMLEEEKPHTTLTTTTTDKSKVKTTTESESNAFGFNTEGESVPVSDGKVTATTESDPLENETKTIATGSGTRELTRSGNIGVTTSQQMLQSELDLRRYDFMGEVFKCLDRILFSGVYR